MLSCPHCATPMDTQDAPCPSCGTSPSPPAGPVPTSAAGGAGPPSESPATGQWLLERVRQASAGRFEISAQLGQGGMAAVYLARDLKLHREVALKVMLPGLEMTPGMADRFMDEARRTAALHHPNIVIVHDVVELGDVPAIVMNRVNGCTLEQAVPYLGEGLAGGAGRLPLPVVRHLLRQVANALDYAHENGIVHRDVKPSNVMVTVKGDVVVSDFGIARVVSGDAQRQSSMLLGTPTYMSPEQCQGLPVSGASDQYALGILAYELLAGAPPFIGDRYGVQYAHIFRDPPSLRYLDPDLPHAVVQAVARMLAKRPEDRYRTVTAAIDALAAGVRVDESACRQLIGTAAASARAVGGQPRLRTTDPRSTPGPAVGPDVGRADPSPPSPTPPGARRRRPLVAAGILAGAALVAVAAWRGWGRSDAQPLPPAMLARLSLEAQGLLRTARLEPVGPVVEPSLAAGVGDGRMFDGKHLVFTARGNGRPWLAAQVGSAEFVASVRLAVPPRADGEFALVVSDARGRVHQLLLRSAPRPGFRVLQAARVLAGWTDLSRTWPDTIDAELVSTGGTLHLLAEGATLGPPVPLDAPLTGDVAIGTAAGREATVARLLVVPARRRAGD